MIGRGEFIDLMRAAESPAVTITLPTHKTFPGTQQDPIRFKNLLGRARAQLEAAGVTGREASVLMRPAEALLADDDFWLHQDEGLAVFLDPSGVHAERVDVALPESVEVGDTFAVRPLLGAFDEAARYFVLAASYDDVRLFEGDRHGLRRIESEALPKGMQALSGMTEISNAVHFHPTGPAGTTHGRPSAKFHGAGSAPPEEKEKLRQHFAADIAKAVDAYLSGNGHPPMVLVADERLAGAVAAHARSDFIRSPETQESPASLDERALHDIAWPAFRATLDNRYDRDLEHFRARYGDGDSRLASIDVEEIAQAALMGRIELLLIDAERRIEGRLDTGTGKVELGSGGDLSDTIARLTLLNGGEVHPMPADVLPTEAGIAAVFRYALQPG